MRHLIITVVVLATGVSCGQPSYSPGVYKAALAMKVYPSLEEASGVKYTVIKQITARQGFRGPMFNEAPISPEAAISAAKTLAASLGANAIIVLECKTIGMTWASNNDMECVALAVRIK